MITSEINNSRFIKTKKSTLGFSIHEYLILLFAFGPLVGYLTESILDMGFYNVMSFLTSVVLTITVLLKYKQGVPFKIPKYLVCLIVFYLYTLFSHVFIAGNVLLIKHLYQDRLMNSICILLIIENTFFSSYLIKKLYQISFFIIVVSFVVIVIQQIYNPLFLVSLDDMKGLLYSPFYEQRLVSIFSWMGGGIAFGFSFIPLLSIVINNLIIKKKTFFIMLFYAIGSMTVFLQKSRWVILNFLLLLFIPVLYKRKKLQSLIILSIFVLILIFVNDVVLQEVDVNVDEIISKRILQENRGGITEGSAGTRLLAFEIFFKLFPNNPFWGVGNTKYVIGGTGKHNKGLEKLLKRRSSQIHIGYLSLFYYYGIFGGIWYILFLYYLGKKLYKNASTLKYWGVFFAFLTFALSNLTLVYFPIFQMGLVIVFVINKYFEQLIDSNRTFLKISN